MTTRRSGKWLSAWLAVCAILLPAGEARAASFTWEIAVNTSAIEGTAGYLDFQFNPGDPSFDPASATLSGFVSDGTLTGALSDAGSDVTGTLPGTVVLNNDLLNDHTEGFTIGSFFDVFVTLDIPDVSGSATGGNRFSVDVQDSGFNSILGRFPAIEIDLDATTGQPTVTNNSGGAAVVSQTPEPASLLLIVSGIAGVLAVRKRSWRLRAHEAPGDHLPMQSNDGGRRGCSALLRDPLAGYLSVYMAGAARECGRDFCEAGKEVVRVRVRR